MAWKHLFLITREKAEMEPESSSQPGRVERRLWKRTPILEISSTVDYWIQSFSATTTAKRMKPRRRAGLKTFPSWYLSLLERMEKRIPWLWRADKR